MLGQKKFRYLLFFKGLLNIIFLYIDFFLKHKILQMLKRKISIELDWRLDQQTL